MKAPKRFGLEPHHINIIMTQKSDNYRNWEKWMIEQYVEYQNLYHPEPYYNTYRLTKESVRRMSDFFRELLNNPSAEIEVVSGIEKDYICSSLCDNFVGKKCKYVESGMGMAKEISAFMGELSITQDKEEPEDALKKYGLSVGQIITVGELIS